MQAPLGSPKRAKAKRLRTRTVQAVVVSGMGTLTTRKSKEGEASRRDEIARRTGIVKVPGSLNLRSAEPLWFKRRDGIRWSHGYLFHARVNSVHVVVNKQLKRIATQPHLMHVYSSVRLRDELNIVDGSVVEVEIPEGVLLRFAPLHRAVYRARLLRRRLASKS